jgi:two-component system sensor histidine kinase KdpD
MHDDRPSPDDLLREYARRARLTVYLAAAAGAGKTRRLADDARRLQTAGLRVVVGRLATKGRPDLDSRASGLTFLPGRRVDVAGGTFEDFDLEAALRLHPDIVILDELAHSNLPGGTNEKAWQDALALRDAGIGVIGALNVAHVDTVAATAERATGRPLREIVPFSFLQHADEVIALDISPQMIQQRLRAGKIVAEDDVERALDGPFSDASLYALRELLLRTVDQIATATVRAERASFTIAIALPGVPLEGFLRRTAAFTAPLDLALHVAAAKGVEVDELQPLMTELHADVLGKRIDPDRIDAVALGGSLLAVPLGSIARHFTQTPPPQNLLVVDVGQTYLGGGTLGHSLARTSADRMRRGYGKLTVYLGAAAGVGKTYGMLDRAQQLRADGTDVIAAYIETHGRAETAAMTEGLDVLPHLRVESAGIAYEELDRDRLLARKPQVALIDELAHTNAPGSAVPKRYEDVLAVLRAGIDVITTLNVQHLEGLNDTVERLTGTVVRETLPDDILALADEVILIDATPETLRTRLREGKIYPPERVDSALANFFRRDNLEALRELALREAVRNRTRRRVPAPFDRLILGVTGERGDDRIARRASALAARLQVEFAIALVHQPKHAADEAVRDAIRAEAQRFGASYTESQTDDVAGALLELARSRPETMLAVSQHNALARFFRRTPLARVLLDAGARELLVIAPSDARPAHPRKSSPV